MSTDNNNNRYFEAINERINTKWESRIKSEKDDYDKKFNLKLKLERAISTTIKNQQQLQYTKRFSKYFNVSKNYNNIIVTDLQTWEDFFSYYIQIINKESLYNPEERYIKIKHNDIPRIKEEDDTKFLLPAWIPPRSPHNLIEETLYNNPWALLVATIFLNKTSCTNARPYLMEFLKNYPDPESVLKNQPYHFEIYFVKLGLVKKRAEQVWKMSYDYLNKDWKNVKELYGIGKYGEDAFRMFCLGDLNVEPNDRFLKIYKAWYNKIVKKNEDM